MAVWFRTPSRSQCDGGCATAGRILCLDGERIISVDQQTGARTYLDNGGALQFHATCSADRKRLAWVDFRDPPGQVSAYFGAHMGGEIYLHEVEAGTTRRLTYDSPGAPITKSGVGIGSDLAVWFEPCLDCEKNFDVEHSQSFWDSPVALVRLELSSNRKCRLDRELEQPSAKGGRRVGGGTLARGAFVAAALLFVAVAHAGEPDRSFRRRGSTAVAQRSTEPESPAGVAEPAPAAPQRDAAKPAVEAPAETPNATSATFDGETSSLARNALSIELAGNGLFWSANYERRLTRALLVRGGLGYFNYCSDACTPLVTSPLTAELLLGTRDHSLDVGGGLVVSNEAGVLGAIGTAIIGYRYQPYQGGLLIRIAFTPLWLGKGMVPWGGLMGGYAF